MKIYKCNSNIIEEYQINNPFMISLSNHILDIVKRSRKSGHALDVGCGLGKNSLLLASLGFTVDAIDIECNVLAQAKQHKDITYTKFDITKKYICNSAYDVIVCSEVLEHLQNPSDAIKNMEHMLKPSGLMIITVPSAHLPCSDMYIAGGHVKHYTKAEIHTLLANFSIMSTNYVGFPIQFLLIKIYTAYQWLFKKKYIAGSLYANNITLAVKLRKIIYRVLTFYFKLDLLFYKSFRFGTNIILTATIK